MIRRAANKLPALVRVVSDASDMDAAMALIKRYGGLKMYIPAKASDTHWLVMTIGRKAADAVMKAFVGEKIKVPNGDGLTRRLAAAKALDAGASINEAAVASGLHSRSVERVRRPSLPRRASTRLTPPPRPSKTC